MILRILLRTIYLSKTTVQSQFWKIDHLLREMNAYFPLTVKFKLLQCKLNQI